MKLYQVIFQDEWNNLTLLGFYRDLDKATEDINDVLSAYGKSVKCGDVQEYMSTFGTVFDTEIEDDQNCLMIRGFILDDEDVKRCLDD